MRKPVALITGSSRGIGFACACQLAKSGFDIVINSRNSQSDNHDLLLAKEEIHKLGAKCVIAQGDISVIAEHENIIQTVLKNFETIDCLINNAGTGAKRRGDLLHLTEDSWDHCLNLNAKGLFFLSQKVASLMLDDDLSTGINKTIINITSCSAKILSPDRAEYCVSKVAASMATQLLALRLADTKVKVFEIRPGIIKTDMTLPVKDKYDAFIADGLVPEGRWGEPDDVAQVASMLALNSMPYTVGQIFDVDGGLHFHSF